MSSDKQIDDEAEAPTNRRTFVSAAAGVGMAGGLLAGYGSFAAIAGSYLYPASGPPRAWMFVSELSAISVGAALSFVGPKGEKIAIARRSENGTATDFVALSTVCPHLGCQVFWESENDRFFCPCHNGEFDATGKGTGGPPAKAGQRLSSYPLMVDAGLLYIEVAAGERAEIEAPPKGKAIALAQGHDPCLYQLTTKKSG